MKSTLRTVLLTLLAALALSAVATSAALASPEWFVKKSGIFTKASTAVKVHLEASKFTFIDNTGELYNGWSCSGYFGEGTIESGGLGKIGKFEPELPEKHCKGGELKKGVNECEELKKLIPFDLPWSTALYTEGSEIRATLGSSGAGAPGFEYTCRRPTGTFVVICQLSTTTSTHMINNASAGLVEAEFNTKSKKALCESSGHKQKEIGEFSGIIEIEPTEAEKKAGVEAIKVE
jgi:hypothetical protein